ncbi:MAG: DUF1667 domain-containing protein [Treponema sp.]|nr:DUF1667 domain-containing protein [Treponema sp.]
MRNLTCIVCPIGCRLEVDDNLAVTGSQCKRGETYAKEEISAPKRTVTATMQIQEDMTSSGQHAVKRVPVKTASPCLREYIDELLADIYSAKVKLPVKTGDIIIKGWKPKNKSDQDRFGEGIDITAARTII